MTNDQIERCNALWRRLHADKLVWWMPGMADASDANRGRVEDSRDWTGTGMSVWGSLHGECPPTPDWTDPATRGCLLEMAREAFPDATTQIDGGLWWVAAREGSQVGSADTEAEALLLAIEATKETP